MAEHYNRYALKHFAATVAHGMDLPLPEAYAPPIAWAADTLRARLGGPADRVVLYHADAVGLYLWQKYTPLFAPVQRHTTLALPFVSTVTSVTPVAHASMYTGLDPEGHGIRTYVRPRLTCDTLFDRFVAAGLRVAIIAMTDSTFLRIFAGRAVDYFEVANPTQVLQKATELIRGDAYDVISIHTFEYDNAAHAYGPESKEALNALSIEAEHFAQLVQEIARFGDRHRYLYAYAPDHGQHLTDGGAEAHGSLQSEDMNVVHFFGTL